MYYKNLTTQTPTILGSWVLLVAKSINSYGVESDNIFKEAGIDLADIKKNDTRFPSAMMKKAWEIAVQRTQDPYIAIRVAHFFKPSSYSALGMSMAASRNIYDAIKRCVRYSHLISDSTISTLEETENDVALVLKSRPEFRYLTHIYGISATLCCMHYIFREVAGNSLRIKEVHFSEGFESTKPLEEFFSCPIFYDSNCNKIVFDKKCVFLEQSFTHSELTRSLDEWTEEYLAQKQEVNMSTLVQKSLLKNLTHSELDQDLIASDLGISIRKLQRMLSEEGTTYSILLNNFQKKLAIKLMSKNELPLSKVSTLLGFSCQSNFTRAFKRWTGTTPKKYRS